MFKLKKSDHYSWVCFLVDMSSIPRPHQISSKLVCLLPVGIPDVFFFLFATFVSNVAFVTSFLKKILIEKGYFLIYFNNYLYTCLFIFQS